MSNDNEIPPMTSTDEWFGTDPSDEPDDFFEDDVDEGPGAKKLSGLWSAQGPSNYPSDAATFLERNYTAVDGQLTLVYHRGQFLYWNTRHWEVIEADQLRAQVSRDFESAVLPSKPPTGKKSGDRARALNFYIVNRDSLANLIVAIQNHVIISEKANFNSWLSSREGDPDPADLVPLRNGLLDRRTRDLMAPTPRFLNTYALTFDYDPAATSPKVLSTFLDSVFGGDVERRDLLQELIGYLCTPGLEKHKMFALVGPPRSGKGTIARLVKQLVGRENYGATSLSGLGESHGLESIATKSVVILGDAAATGRSPERALENLLQIIGEDDVDVNPKNKKQYAAKLPCRFLMLTNDLPKLPDRSEALKARTLVLKFTVSFLGREDQELNSKLAAELPAIFNWALDGLDRLRERGEFVQPAMGTEDMEIVADIAAPERRFVRELCMLSQEVRDATEDLFLAWQNWCSENNVRAVGSREEFAKALRTVDPNLSRGKTQRVNGKQRNATIGIALTPEARGRYVKSGVEFKLQGRSDASGGGGFLAGL